jgi:hypothetical protein
MNFSESIIQEIKEAQSEDDVVKAIDNSFSKLAGMNPRQVGTYHILNMIVTLQVTLAETLSDNARANVKLAIKIFREYQRLTPGRII